MERGHGTCTSAREHDVATLYRLQGKTGLAEDLWMRGLQIHLRLFGDFHPQTALVMRYLAEFVVVERRY